MHNDKQQTTNYALLAAKINNNNKKLYKKLPHTVRVLVFWGGQKIGRMDRQQKNDKEALCFMT